MLIMEEKPRLCVVCGARVTNMNPQANTCSATCTHARDCGMSRGEWIAVMTRINSRRYDLKTFQQPRY